MNARAGRTTGVETPSTSEQRTSDLVALLGHELLESARGRAQCHNDYAAHGVD
jgi:hypothetical protein